MQPKVDEVQGKSEKGFQKSRTSTSRNTNRFWQEAYGDFMAPAQNQKHSKTVQSQPQYLDFSKSPSIYAPAYA